MINEVTLIGRVGKDPEAMQNGPVKFSMATTDKWKDKQTGEKKEKTQWHNVIVWGKLAEIAMQYIHKGNLVYLQGKIEYGEYEKDGQKRYFTNIVAAQLKNLEPKPANGQQGGTYNPQYGTPGVGPAYQAPAQQTPSPQHEEDTINVEDIPF